MQIPKSALLSACARGDASLYAVFSGQGTNDAYFNELKALYETDREAVAYLVNHVTTHVFLPETARHEYTMFC